MRQFRLGPYWWHALGAYAFVIVGAAATISGIRSTIMIEDSRWLWLVGLGSIAVAFGETLALLLAPGLRTASPGHGTSKAPPRIQMPRRAIPGAALGFIVGFAAFAWPLRLGLADSLPAGSRRFGVLLLLLVFCAFVAVGIGLAIAHTSKKWRDAPSRRLALRLTANTVICSGIIYIAAVALFTLFPLSNYTN